MRCAPAVLLLACTIAACRGTDSVSPGRHAGDAARGSTAFAASCAGCHASGDGSDLAFFNFTDTTIVRRAVKHVDTLTAYDIVAHIRALGVHPASETVRLFQPGDEVLASDVDFATRLFGADAWPAGLTSAGLAAIDPRTVEVAVAFPHWSDEHANTDWMPDSALPAAILDDQGQAARAAIAGYRAAPTIENLTRAVVALRSADRRTGNAAAPCFDLETLARVDFPTCFQVRRWTATLIAQHFLRYGLPPSVAASVSDALWDVGNVARKSIAGGLALDNAKTNWPAWMYMGWTFDPSRHASVYTGNGLNGLGLQRHATFLALRSAVARPAGSETPYEDVGSAISFAPASWAYAVSAFGYQHLLDRIAAGDLPTDSAGRAAARTRMQASLTAANKKVTLTAERSALSALQTRVLNGLGTP